MTKSNNNDNDDDNHVNRTAIFDEFPSSFPLSSFILLTHMQFKTVISGGRFFSSSSYSKAKKRNESQWTKTKNESSN